MAEHNKPEKDQVSGVETTGHEWDGIKELNNPLPRWWLWVFYVTIIWSIGYWVVYPAWPTGADESNRGGTKGIFEWTQYKKLEEEQNEIVARRSKSLQRFHQASFEEIVSDPELYAFAQAGGQAAFRENCAACHGTGGIGAPGYPNLNDDDWIWGGDMASIYQTIRYGARMHEDGRQTQMPPFGDMLKPQEIAAVAEYVEGIYPGKSHVSTEPLDATALVELPTGERIYRQNCAACHGNDGKGSRELGAPNLADAIWLMSNGDQGAIMAQVHNPRHGMMPAWEGRLDEDTLRQLSVYVHSLGGGE